jgi:hypothetical protein
MRATVFYGSVYPKNLMRMFEYSLVLRYLRSERNGMLRHGDWERTVKHSCRPTKLQSFLSGDFSHASLWSQIALQNLRNTTQAWIED